MLLAAISLIFVTSCKDDDKEEPAPELAKPTIGVVSPTIPAGGIVTEAGSTITFTLGVAAEAGLSTLSLGETNIKTYAGTELSDTTTYDYLAKEVGTENLSFVVEDAQGDTAVVTVTVTIEEGIDLGYLLIDFAGSVSATEDKTVADWDIRTLYTFGVTGSFGSSATGEVVNQQSKLFFAQTNPDASDNAKVIKIVGELADTSVDNWGGWSHVIFGLGTAIPEDTITQLPAWDNAGSVTVPGTKVIQIDAYYDATVDANFTWGSLLALTGVWNADATLGYKIDLCIASYDPMGVVDGGHDGAMYVGYTAYIGEPNKWVTLTFDAVDVGRTAHMFGVDANSPGPDAIDCVKIIPAGGYKASTSNALYFKNLRIVDVE